MLCDVTMPGESGFTLLAHVHEAAPRTGRDHGDRRRFAQHDRTASRHGAYGCIFKPFDTNVILINIVGALNRRAEQISEIARSRTHIGH